MRITHNKKYAHETRFLLTFILAIVVFSGLNSQSITPHAFLHKTLVENEQLNSIKQFIQKDADTPPILGMTATVIREKRQINIQYESAMGTEVSSSLYTYNEAGKPLSFVSYTASGKQKLNERYAYKTEGTVERWSIDQEIPEAEK